MKKVISVLFIILFILSAVSCAGENNSSKVGKNNTPGVDDILNQGVNGDSKTDDIQSGKEIVVDDSGEKYDVDLTKMSSTMIYAEVYNMIYNSDTYVGKYVKMAGKFAIYEGDTRIYFACIVPDATACCTQGIEFVLKGDFKYPEDYPALGADIVIAGVYELYEEDGFYYCQLADAKMYY